MIATDLSRLRFDCASDARDEVGEFLLEKWLAAGHIELAQVGDEWV